MKIFKKRYLPESIEWNGDTYVMRNEIAELKTPLKDIERQAKKQGQKIVFVSVLPYYKIGKEQPRTYVFISQT